VGSTWDLGARHMGMVSNQHQSNLNPLMLFCPRSEVEHLNPPKSFKVVMLLQYPFHLKNSITLCTLTTLGRMLIWFMGGTS
jgi:hypothetical protein